MPYLTSLADRDKAESSDGSVIPCNYLNHSRFSHECELSLGLHYTFMRFVPDRSYSKGYEIRKAINIFLDYVEEYESKSPIDLHLTRFQDITAEIFFSYDRYCKRESAPIGLATRLKSALQKVAQEHDEGMPLLTLPFLSDSAGKPREPLNEDTFNEMTNALKLHIDILYKNLEFRAFVDKTDPYTYKGAEAEIKSTSLRHWKPLSEKLIKTFLVNHHPFSVSFEHFLLSYKSKDDEYFNGNILSLIYKWLTDGSLRYSGDPVPITLKQLLDLYYPTPLDMAAIVIFIQLQTGWNKEIVIAIDKHNFEHALTGAVKSSQVVIKSEKRKSQSLKKPFLKPKTFLSPSDKTDKYSTYSLIVLAQLLAEPLADLPHDCTTKNAYKKHNSLFICMRAHKCMTHTETTKGGRPGRYLSIANKNQWTTGVRDFFKKYKILDKGKRIETAKDLNGRLRPTWIRYVRDRRKRPLSVVALEQGHNKSETTDVFYDSSGPAMQKRRERLRSELESVTRLLRERKFKGMLGKRSDSKIDFTLLRLFNIPGHDKTLWACMDSYKADWPGVISHIPLGSKCTAIPKCLFCSQICILEDSLPFLIERQTNIQKQLEQHNERAFNSPLSDELKIIEYILDEWGDNAALKKAARYQRKHQRLLPTDMQLLSLLLED